MEKNEKIASAICRIDYPVKTRIPDCYIDVSAACNSQEAAMNLEYKQYRGLFDTGAERSVISPRVAADLNLKPFDTMLRTYMDVTTENDVYAVNFLLGNLGFGNIAAAECPMIHNDVIIGMDVISRGDFFLTQENEKTVLFFRVPPIGLKNLGAVAQFPSQIPADRPLRV